MENKTTKKITAILVSGQNPLFLERQYGDLDVTCKQSIAGFYYTESHAV